MREDVPLGNLAVAVHGVPAMFHGLPSFALPYKRFVTEVVCDRPGTEKGQASS
jgi:hypothetical protein